MHDLFKNFLERRVALLLPENFQALDQRQAGIDHGGHLTGEDDDVLACYAWLEKCNVLEKVFGFLLDDRINDAQALDLRQSSGLIRCLQLTFAFFTVRIFSLPDIDRHAYLLAA